MQPLARELSFSETVFVLPRRAEGHAAIRIFTPTRELPFAGHPVLGTAFVLAAPMQLDEIRLETVAGVVPVRVAREGSRIVFGWMTQPTPGWRAFEREAELLAGLGVERSLLPVEVYDLGPTHVYVALGSPDEVAALRPNLAALAELDVGVNCFAGGGTRWKTRMFAPAHGVDEDPATGSAAGPLAVHLGRHGWAPFGEELTIEQGAEIGRPSRLHAVVEGSGDRIERVDVGGSAVVVARGEFRL
jgi:trans-2,3-dihydro-3-hydroxyanthranilate isomerase